MIDFVNPIDKDKVAENPGLLPYAHSVGGPPIKPEDQDQSPHSHEGTNQQTNAANPKTGGVDDESGQ
jgi:hypothetical protein